MAKKEIHVDSYKRHKPGQKTGPKTVVVKAYEREE